MSRAYPYQLVGIECHKGWASLYEPLIARCEAEGVAILQIKQKNGGLRFYVDSTSPELHAAIDKACARSFHICEECGAPGVCRDGRCIRTLCDEHASPSEPEAA